MPCIHVSLGMVNQEKYVSLHVEKSSLVLHLEQLVRAVRIERDFVPSNTVLVCTY